MKFTTFGGGDPLLTLTWCKEKCCSYQLERVNCGYVSRPRAKSSTVINADSGCEEQ